MRYFIVRFDAERPRVMAEVDGAAFITQFNEHHQCEYPYSEPEMRAHPALAESLAAWEAGERGSYLEPWYHSILSLNDVRVLRQLVLDPSRDVDDAIRLEELHALENPGPAVATYLHVQQVLVEAIHRIQALGEPDPDHWYGDNAIPPSSLGQDLERRRAAFLEMERQREIAEDAETPIG